MMNFRKFRTESGLTLVELLVAMAMSGVLFAIVIQGVVFIERYCQQWSQENKLVEEVIFCRNVFEDALTPASRITLFQDSLVAITPLNDTTRVSWKESTLRKNGRQQLADGTHLFKVTITRLPLPTQDSLSILEKKPTTTLPSGLYGITFVLEDSHANKKTSEFTVTNKDEYLKATQ
jgi:prepilin-type N-terminal cleavage/methylation domain-containing protein